MVGPLAEPGTSKYLSTLTPMDAIGGIWAYGTPGVPGRASLRAASAPPDQNSPARATRLALAIARKAYKRACICGFKGFIERSFLGAPQPCDPTGVRRLPPPRQESCRADAPRRIRRTTPTS